MQGPEGLDVRHAILGGGHGFPVGGPIGPRCSLPRWTGCGCRRAGARPPEQLSGPVQPGVCLSSDQPRDPPMGLGCATGAQGACILTCIFTSFCPRKTPAVALPRGWLCVWQAALGPQQAGWFLPSSSWISLLPPSHLTRGQGARPLGWETETEKWKIKTRPDSGPLSELPVESPESMVELGMPATCLQAPPTPHQLLEDSRTPDLLRLWSGQVCPGLVCTSVPLHLGELRGRGLK